MASGNTSADAIQIDDLAAWEGWLESHGGEGGHVWLAIFKKASKKQVVTFDQLLEVALCFGWVDVQTKGIDAERYAIRFVPRRPKSRWSATNRATVTRLLAEGRVRLAGKAALPQDLRLSADR